MEKSFAKKNLNMQEFAGIYTKNLLFADLRKRPHYNIYFQIII